MDLILAQRVAQEFQLIGGEIIVEVEFACLEATDGRGLIVSRIKDDLVYLDVGGAPVVRVFCHRDVIVGDVLSEHERTVGDHVSGLDEVGAKLFDARLVERQRGLVRHQGDQPRCGTFDGDLERLGVDCLHAECVESDRRFRLGGVDRLGALDRVKDVGVAGGFLGILDTAEREDKIIGGEGIAVRPFGGFADLERIDEAVVRNRPALGGAGNDLSAGVIDRQAFVQIL